MTADRATIFVVDDDASMRRSLARLLQSVGYRVYAFGKASELLDELPWYGASCAVLDIRLPLMNGLELQRELRQRECSMPVIFITGHGDIPMSVQAMKDGAVDFLPKPFEAQQLLDAIEQALRLDGEQRQAEEELSEYRCCLERLTPRECDVFELVVTGLSNRQIAADLGLSEKTVKIHRGRVMQKMAVDSLAELVHAAELLGIGLAGK